MAYPTKYVRQYGFQGYQDANPSRPLPGDKVDADYNAVATSVDEIVEFLKLHTRSDGVLKNGVVTMDSLGADVLSAIALGDAEGLATSVVVTPAGGISATNVQAALEELDTEKQPLDADLTALAALSATGLVARTAAATYVPRTLTGTAFEVTVTNGDGVSGNPTVSFPSTIAIYSKLLAVGDSNFTIRDVSDTTKGVLFNVDGVTTGTVRTLTVQNASGTLAYTADLAAYQPLDADLTALAALASTAGLLARTGADAFAVRALTAPAAGITVSNGTGASGNPTLALANDLSALEALASTGIAVRTATDTWAQRSVAVTAANSGIAVTNGNGVSGNPTLNLHAMLENLAGLTTAADRGVYWTALNTSALFTLTSFGRSLVDDADASAARTTLGVRDVLSANRTYYVRTDGSDSNTGLVNSSGGAFLTLQKAWNTILTLDLAGYSVTVSIGAGTYSAGVAATTAALGGAVTFNGAGATTIIQTTTGNCFSAGGGARYTVSNLKMTSTSGQLVLATEGGTITIGAGLTWGSTSGAHIRADSGGNVLATFGSAHTIDGGAAYHVWALGGFVNLGGIADTLSGTPAFTAFANASFLGRISAFGYTFSSTATGARYNATENSMINTFGGGASYFPGNSAGATATGGVYA